MSIQAVAWALQQYVEDAAAKLVLIVLANHANHKTGVCYPSVALIADESSQSERTVQRKLRDLVVEGLVTVEHRPNKSSLYTLQIHGGRQSDTSGDGGDNLGDAGDAVSPGGDTSCSGGDTVVTHNQRTITEPSHPNLPAGKGRFFIRSNLKSAILERCCQAIAGAGVGEGAADTHDLVERALQDAGFETEREAFVSSRGDGRRGRIDLLAERDGVDIAIEIDAEVIRKKSLIKLAHQDGYKVGVLRSSKETTVPAGLDALVILDAPATKLLPPPQMFIDEGTEQWNAHVAAGHGRTLTMTHNGRRGWWFRTEWPPGAHPQPPPRGEQAAMAV